MHDYEPSSHRIPLRDIITAWVVALAVCAILLVLPGSVRKDDAGGTDVGMKTAIEQTIPRDTDLLVESRPSR